MRRETLHALIAEALRPAHFFVPGPARLAWQEVPAEEIVWEIYLGRLLDASQTRQRRTFHAWNVYWIDAEGCSAEPILSVKLETATGRVYVVRSIYSHAWEAYDAGHQVIRSRPVCKWLRELVAVLESASYDDPAALQSDLRHRLFQAVIGVSRLPLTSVEAPLPAFSLGQLAYFSSASADGQELRSWTDLLAQLGKLSGLEQTKLLETVLRATPPTELPAAAREFADRWQRLGRGSADLPKFFLDLFDEVALSPWTDFVDRTLRLLQLLQAQGSLTAADHADVLSALLRRLSRHLQAFDLVKFHHRGANYPDALLVDAVLRALLDLLEQQPHLFLEEAQRLRRRGLRQGWLLRCRYQGHAVPEVPTSPGENARVLPPPFPHLEEEQILDPARRPRRLFAEGPLPLSGTARQVLELAWHDLEHPRELRELGMALFLDRPLGKFKRAGEPDQTPLLSYVAFSRSLAERQLHVLGQCADGLLREETLRARLPQSMPIGVPLALYPEPPRPGVPSLQDAWQVAVDFVLLHTSRRTVADFLQLLHEHLRPDRLDLGWLFAEPRLLIVGGGAVQGTRPGTLLIFDAALRPRLELGFDARAGYRQERSGELPAQGLQLLRCWDV